MKKIFGLVLVALSIGMTGYCQTTNDNNGDDTYTPQPSDNYSDDNANADNNDNGNNGDVTYQTFYDQLSPYGSWVNYPESGYVWVPNQAQDPNFSPYVSGGHWVYSDEGWTWVSDYAWGWAPFHYGRWFMDDTYGWMWQPGYQWAPAWVEWGNYEGYYCWAPIGPHGYISSHYRPEGRYWNFVDRNHITDVNIRDRAFANRGLAHSVPNIENHINVISRANTYRQAVYFAGPRAEEVSKATGQRIEPVHIAATNRPQATHVAGNQLNIYRPAMRTTPNQPAPPKVGRTEDLKPVNRPGNAPAQQQQSQPIQRNTSVPEQQRPQPTTPPRQSTPLPQRSPTEQPAEKPHGRYFEPNPAPQQQARPVQSAPQRSYSAPAAPQRSFSAPSAPSRSFSAPAGGGGGGGARGGGGRGR